jgi:probable RcsB/C two-component-system connector, global regulator of biofilm formation and acid-resistance
MRQNIHVQSDVYAGFHDTALSEYFRNAGDKLAEESAIFAAAVSCIMASEGHLTNKAIILWLINALETTDDVVTSDIIRKTLEIVVGYTMDDI